jgi:hypothetical protein
MPQVIVNKQKWQEAVEGLELSRELAKQVLSQLSYTPMTGNSFYFRWNWKKGQAAAEDCGREQQPKQTIRARNS